MTDRAVECAAVDEARAIALGPNDFGEHAATWPEYLDVLDTNLEQLLEAAS